MAAGNAAVAALVETAPVRRRGSVTHAGRSASEGAALPVIDRDELAGRLARTGRGHDVPADIRDEFEVRTGEPLGPAHLHTDTAAHEIAQRLAADAVTVGRDVYFAPGRYDPGDRPGRWLLAHELAHVQQRQPGLPRGVARDDVSVSRPEDEAERAADAFADAFVSEGESPLEDTRELPG